MYESNICIYTLTVCKSLYLMHKIIIDLTSTLLKILDNGFLFLEVMWIKIEITHNKTQADD